MHGSSLHLLDFFPGQSAPPGVSAQLGSAPPLVPQSRHFLLCGPERSGKTTLIFSLAYSLAARGASVLILGSRERMERSPPALPAGVPPSDPGWSRVHMKYVEDSSTLLRYISLLHLAPDPPTVLLIDELEQIVASQSGSLGSGAGSHGRHGSRDGQLCRILAVAKDTLEHLGRVTQRPVLLGVTAYTSGPTEPPRGLHMLQRWLPLLLGCRPTREGSSMLCALGQATKSMDGPSPQGPGVEFSISVAGLVAEAVHLNVEGAITAKGAQ